MKKMLRFLFQKYQNVYLFITILMVSGALAGLLFSTFINVHDISQFSSYLNAVNASIDKYAFFLDQFGSGIAFVGVLFLLGTSIIGMPFLSFIIFSKGLQIGFSCALFIYAYQLKGIVGIFIALLPQVLFDVAGSLLASACAIQLSLHLMHTATSKDRLDLRKLFNYILSDVCIVCIIVLLGAYVKSTLVIELIRLFNLL